MLLALYQRSQNNQFIDPKVWIIALNCLLLWITLDGKVLFDKFESFLLLFLLIMIIIIITIMIII